MADTQSRIRITAVDESTRPLNSIRDAVKGLTGDFGKLSGALSAIGVTGAIVGLTAMVKGAVNAAASMADLSQKTGIAVKELTALDYAMRREGVSTEAFGKAMKDLSKSLVEANDESSKSARIFKTLGVDLNAGPREALLKMADAFKALPDGATKAALATEVFGKAGLDLIPALNAGAEGIREIEEEARRLGITFGGETAAAAKEFQDKMFALGESSKSLGITLANLLLPNINRIATAMRDAAIDGGTWKAVLVGIGGVMSEAIGLNSDTRPLERIRDILKEVAETEAKLAEVRAAAATGFFAEARKREGIELEIRLGQLREELRLLGAINSFTGRGGVGAPGGTGVTGGSASPITESALARILGGVKQAREEVDALAKAVDGLMGRLDSKAGGFESGFQADLTLLTAAFQTGRISVFQYQEAMAKLLSQQPLVKSTFEEEAKFLKEISDLQAKRAKDLQVIVDEISKEEDANRMRGLARSAIESITIARMEDRLEQLRVIEGAEDEIRALEAQINARIRLRNVIKTGEDQQAATRAQTEALRDQQRVWEDLSTVAGNFFADLVINGRDAFDNLKRYVKQLLAEMLALFAKRWVLQLAGISGGMAYGSDSVAGMLLNAGGNYLSGSSGWLGAAGSWLLGGGVGVAGSTGIGLGASATAGFYGATGSGTTIGGAMGSGWLSQVMPYLGWIAVGLAAAAASIKYYGEGFRNAGLPSMRDPQYGWASSVPDTKYRFLQALGLSDRVADIMSGGPIVSRLFGHSDVRADAYGWSGDFMGRALDARQWQDYSRRGGTFRGDIRNLGVPSALNEEQTKFFDSFLRSIGVIVDRIGTSLGVNVNEVLANFSHAFSFQLTENGEMLSDERIGEMLSGLFGDVLQKQVAALLEAGGENKLAEYIRGLTEEGDALTAKVVELANVMAGLQAIDLKGLDAEALLAWQRAGETLTDTFQRVAGQMTDFDNAFLTEAQKFERAQAAITKTFADLNIEVPLSAKSFYDLVHGLDLSTEAGRKMFDSLLGISGTFLAVQNAAANMMGEFDALMGRLRPGYTANLQNLQLTSAVQQFQASNGWSSGMSIQDFLTQLRTITREDFARYSASNQQLILTILSLDSTMQDVSDTIAEVVLFPPGSISDAGGDRQRALWEEYQRMRGPRMNLRDHLDNLLLGPSSPLDPMQRFSVAQREYQELLGLAQAGDADAAERLRGSHGTYLELARSIFGSGSAFVDIFNRTFDEVAGVAEVASLNERMLETATESMQYHVQAVNTLIEVRDLLARIAEKSAVAGGGWSAR